MPSPKRNTLTHSNGRKTKKRGHVSTPTHGTHGGGPRDGYGPVSKLWTDLVGTRKEESFWERSPLACDTYNDDGRCSMHHTNGRHQRSILLFPPNDCTLPTATWRGEGMAATTKIRKKNDKRRMKKSPKRTTRR